MNTSKITNYKPKDFAELLGVSVKTLQRWDREGTLKANRTPTNRRFYPYAQYLQFKGINIGNDKRQVVIYARVSTKNQKDDLLNQVAFLRQFCNAKGIIVDQCMEDYGSGLNYNRKKWNELLDEVMEQKIKTIIVTHKDRFIRFGYDWFEKFCMKFNTTIVVVNNEELSPQEELVQDIVSILHEFSGRLYGLRKYKKQIEMCVMRHRIADKPHLTFPGDLLHHRCLSNARRPDQKDRPLSHKRKCIASHCILMQICPQGMCDLFFCFLYVHIFVCSPYFIVCSYKRLVSCPPYRTPAPTSAPGASSRCALQKQKPSHSPGQSADKCRLHR